MAINKFKYRYRFVTTLDFGGIGWGGGGVLVLGLPGQLREVQVLAAFVFFVVRH